jgi:parvulin-like peptidyl-prolyl isomerase
MKKTAVILLLIPFVVVWSCKKGEKASKEKAVAGKNEITTGRADEPDRVAVQHILISFQGAIPDEKVTRTREEAEVLAQALLLRAKSGEDFDALVKAYTDDQYPGIYRMSNIGIAPDSSQQEYPREKMVKAFGDVSFSLGVGEIGMTTYDQETSKYGWHIIKRLE